MTTTMPGPSQRRATIGIALLLATATTAAATDHTGTCIGTFASADNPHRLTGQCTVSAGQTLTIQAGVTLDGQNFTLVVLGTLDVTGATLTNVTLDYRDGSAGTVQTSTIQKLSATNQALIQLSGASSVNPATPLFQGNTINQAAGAGSFGAVVVSGTARPTLTGNQVTSNTVGLHYGGTAAGSATGNTIGFLANGASSRRAIQIDGGASPTVSGNTVLDDPSRNDFGIDLGSLNAASTAAVTGNAVCATGSDVPFRFGLGVFGASVNATVSGSTLPCGGGAGRVIAAGTTDGDTALRALDGSGAYRIEGGWTVAAGQTLAIPAGITLDGQNNQITVNGAVNATGATLTNLTLDYRDGSGGTVQASTLQKTTSTNQGVIQLSGSSSVNPAVPAFLNNTIKLLAGGTSFAGFYVNGTARPTITGNEITTNSAGIRYLATTAAGTATGNTIHFVPDGGTGRRGLQIEGGASPTIDGNTVTDDPARDDVGIDLGGLGAASTATVTNNAVCATGSDVPLRLGPGAFAAPVHATVSGNTFGCGLGVGALLASGTTDGNTMLRPVNGFSAYRMEGSWTVAAGQTLAIPAGLALAGQNNFVVVNGLLNVTGATLTNLSLEYRDGSGGTLQGSTIQKDTTTNQVMVRLVGVSTLNFAAPTIQGNTFVQTAGGFSFAVIDASGTSRPTIVGNQFTINTRAMRFADTAAGSATGNTIGFVPEGASNRHAIEIQGGASPTIDGNTIGNDPTRDDTGIDLGAVGITSAVSVTNNTICATSGDTPLELGPGVFGSAMSATITGNNFTCGLGARVGLITGTTGGDTVLKPINGQSTFRLDGPLTVAAGHTLTIPAGLTLDGQNNSLVVNGVVSVTGATLTNVTLDYRDGSGGTLQGSTLQKNSTSNQALLRLSGSSVLNPAAPTIQNNTFVQTAGAVSFAVIDVSGTARPAITGNQITTNSRGIRYADSAAGTATGNTIGFVAEGASNRQAIEVREAASPMISGNTITDDPLRNDFGIDLGTVNSSSKVAVTDNSLCVTTGDTPYRLGISAFATVAHVTVSGTTFPCGLANGVALATSSTDGNAALRVLDGQAAFRLDGTVTVASGHTLTVPAGLTIDGQSNLVTVNGALNVTGATLVNLELDYRDGSGGTVQGSTLRKASTTNQPIVSLNGVSAANPAVPVFQGNTLVSSSPNLSFAAVEVAGTARPTITGNQITTNTRGIRYSDAAAGSASGNTIVFVTEGGSNRHGVDVRQSASPTVDGNTITDDPKRSDTGVDLTALDPASRAVVTNNAICSTGSDVPIALGLGVFSTTPSATVSGNTLGCGLGAGVQFIGGTASVPTSLKPVNGQSTFALFGTLTVPAGQPLAIPSGITLNGGAIHILGTIAADGATFHNVTFDFEGGGILANSVITSANTGVVLLVRNVSPMITGNTFEGPGTALQVSNTGAPSITGNTFRSFTTGIQLSGTTNPTIDGNTFDAIGTTLRIVTSTSRSTFSHNVLQRNGTSVSFDSAGSLFSAFPVSFETNTFVGTLDKNTIALPGTIDVSGTLVAFPVPYAVSTMALPSGKTLILQPGTVLAMASGGNVTADGELIALGTADAPIVFTVSNPKNGNRWNGLRIANKSAPSQTALRSCIIEFAGRSTGAALSLDNASIGVSECVVSNNNGPGIAMSNSARPEIANSTIYQNGAAGITSASGARARVVGSSIFANGGRGFTRTDCPTAGDLVDAQLNYWGDDTGPKDASDDRTGGGLYNPGGLGDEVSNCIDYDPWIRLGPSTAGTIAVVGGDGQHGTVGACLADPLTVEVDDASDVPLSDIAVTFTVASGDAAIQTLQPVRTGQDGRAAVTVCLGLTPGDVTVTATARDVDSPLAVFATSPSAPAAFALRARPLEIEATNTSGDVDGDGMTTTNDAATIRGVLAGVVEPGRGGMNFGRGDVNHDGRVDEGDARAIDGSVVGIVRSHRRARHRRKSCWAPGTVRVVWDLPADPVAPGDTVRVPVHLDDGAEDVVAYALALRFDRRVLRVESIDGGTFAGFGESPITDPRSFVSGHVAFTASNGDLARTPSVFNVATITFRVVGHPGESSRVAIRRLRRGAITLGGTFRPVRRVELVSSGRTIVVR